MISSILNKELISVNSSLQILWTPANDSFKNFVLGIGHQLIEPNAIYYGFNNPHLIVCNNKVDHYNMCLGMSYKLHIPVLLIDHSIKNPLYDNNKVLMMNQFPCVHHVCLSKTISDSWGLNNIQILNYNANDKDNINIWKNLIFQTAQMMFNL